MFRAPSMFTVKLPVLFLYPVSRGIDELNKGVEVTVCIECFESCGTVDGDLRASQINTVEDQIGNEPADALTRDECRFDNVHVVASRDYADASVGSFDVQFDFHLKSKCLIAGLAVSRTAHTVEHRATR